MASSKNKSRNRGKRPTATIDLKAKDVSEKVDASKVLAKTPSGATSADDKNAPKNTGASAAPNKPTAGSSTKASTGPATTSGAKSQSAASKPADKSSRENRTDKPESNASKNADRKSAPSGKQAGTKSDVSTPRSPKSSGSMSGTLTHLLAGGLGGALALFGVNQFADHAPGTGAGNNGAPAAISEALEARLSALESKPGDTGKAAIPAELESRIKGLEALNVKLAGLAESQSKLAGETTALSSKVSALADPAGGGAVELRQRLDAIEGTMASLAKAAEGASDKSIPKLAALAGRLNDMRTELDAKITATRKSVSSDVEKQLAAITTTLKVRDEEESAAAEVMETLKGGSKRLSLALETAQTETARIADDVMSLRTANEATKSSMASLEDSARKIAERIAALESTTTENISALPSQDDISTAITPVSEKLAAVTEKLDGVIKRESARAESAKRVLLALELANLQRALAQGRPVANELANIKKSAPEGMDLSALDKLAKDNVATQQVLIREFSNVASSAVQAESLDENAGTFEKLIASARSVVRVRKTGDVEGETTEAIIARAEDRLKRNDLSAAVSQLGALKGKAADAFASWLDRARDRLSVDAALAKIESGLKTSVSSSATN